jgi:hypothetical protein
MLQHHAQIAAHQQQKRLEEAERAKEASLRAAAAEEAASRASAAFTPVALREDVDASFARVARDALYGIAPLVSNVAAVSIAAVPAWLQANLSAAQKAQVVALYSTSLSVEAATARENEVAGIIAGVLQSRMAGAAAAQ